MYYVIVICNMKKSDFVIVRKFLFETLAMVSGWLLAEQFTDKLMPRLLTGAVAGAITGAMNNIADKELKKNKDGNPLPELSEDKISELPYQTDHAERIRSEQEVPAQSILIK